MLARSLVSFLLACPCPYGLTCSTRWLGGIEAFPPWVLGTVGLVPRRR